MECDGICIIIAHSTTLAAGSCRQNVQGGFGGRDTLDEFAVKRGLCVIPLLLDTSFAVISPWLPYPPPFLRTGKDEGNRFDLPI